MGVLFVPVHNRQRYYIIWRLIIHTLYLILNVHTSLHTIWTYYVSTHQRRQLIDPQKYSPTHSSVEWVLWMVFHIVAILRPCARLIWDGCLLSNILSCRMFSSKRDVLNLSTYLVRYHTTYFSYLYWWQLPYLLLTNKVYTATYVEDLYPYVHAITRISFIAGVGVCVLCSSVGKR